MYSKLLNIVIIVVYKKPTCANIYSIPVLLKKFRIGFKIIFSITHYTIKIVELKLTYLEQQFGVKKQNKLKIFLIIDLDMHK